MTTWNPNAPSTLGIEWFPTREGEARISGGSVAAQQFRSTAAETIDTLEARLASTGGDCKMIAEIYTADAEVPGSVTTSTFRPTDDKQIGGNDSESQAWVSSSLAVTNLFGFVDEDPIDITDWVTYFDARAPRYRWRVQFGTGGWGASRRIVGGGIHIVADREEVNGGLQVSYHNGTNAYKLGNVTVTTKRQELIVPFPEFNPATGLPWTQADITSLAALSTASIQIRPTNANKQKRLFIYQLWLELDWVTENRLAIGVTNVAESSTPAVTSFTLSHPTSGADNWAKANATNYTILLRRLDDVGVGRWSYMEETPEVSAALLRPSQNIGLDGAALEAYLPTVDTRGFVSALGDRVDGRAMYFTMTTIAPVVSADGQPYSNADLATADTDFDPTFSTAQTLTPASAVTVTQVRWIDAEPPVASFRIRIRRTSTGATLSTATVTTADLVADAVQVGETDGGDPLYLFTAQFPSGGAALSAGVQYNVEATIKYLGVYVDIGAITAGPPTFGGNTDTGPSGAIGGDSLLMLNSEVEALADFAAVTFDYPTDAAAADGAGCTVDEIEVATLTWSGSDLAVASFGYYDIQRLGDDGETWEDVFVFTDKTLTYAIDFEARRGQPETYRGRVVRAADWAPSAWSALEVTTADNGAEDVVFGSNWAQQAFAYIREPDYSGEFPVDKEYLSMSGRDHQLALVGAEDRGETTTVPVVFFAGTDEHPAPDIPGRNVFEAFRLFTHEDVPHFAYCDRDGWRTFCDLTFTPWSRTEPASNYQGSVDVVEVQPQATPFDGSTVTPAAAAAATPVPAAVYYQQQLSVGSGATFTSGTVTPTANRRLVLTVMMNAPNAGATVPTITGLGVTWKLLAVLRASAAATRNVVHYVAQTGDSVSPGPITFTAPTSGPADISIRVTEYSNVWYDGDPLDGIRQAMPIETTGNTNIPSINFNPVARSDSLVVALFSLGSTAITFADPVDPLSPAWRMLTQFAGTGGSIWSSCVIYATAPTDLEAHVVGNSSGSPTILLLEFVTTPPALGEKWAPTFVSASFDPATGNPFVGPDAVTVEWPHQSKYGYIERHDEITGFLVVESLASDVVPTASLFALGWRLVPNSPSTASSGGGSTQQTVFYKKQGQPSEPDVVVPDVGTGLRAMIFTVRGASDDPVDASAVTTFATAVTSITVAGVTATEAKTLAVYIACISANFTFSNFADATLTGLFERYNKGSGSNGGGAIGVWMGLKPVAGSTGNLSANISSATTAACIAIALSGRGAS